MKNERGFSMSGALMAVGLVGITFVAMSTMIQGIQQQRLALEGKFETIKLEQQLNNLIKTPNFCRCNFSGQIAGKKLSFDSATPPTEIDITYSLVMTDAACASPRDLASANQPINPLSRLITNSVRFRNLTNVGPNLYVGDLFIDYRWQNDNMALQPSVLPGIILATSPDGGSNVKVDSCSLTASSPSTVSAHGFIGSSSPASIPTSLSLVILTGAATGMHKPSFWQVVSHSFGLPLAYASDAGPAGGFLFKDSSDKWFAKFYSGSSAYAGNQFEVTTAQKCHRSDSKAICARINGSSLQLTSGNQVTLYYVAY